MLDKEGLAALAERLGSVRERAMRFFDNVQAVQQALDVNDVSSLALTPELSDERESLRTEIKRLSVDVARLSANEPTADQYLERPPS
jgi:hypothetical protein